MLPTAMSSNVVSRLADFCRGSGALGNLPGLLLDFAIGLVADLAVTLGRDTDLADFFADTAWPTGFALPADFAEEGVTRFLVMEIYRRWVAVAAVTLCIT